MQLCLKKTQINEKEARDRPFLKTTYFSVPQVKKITSTKWALFQGSDLFFIYKFSALNVTFVKSWKC